MKTPTSTKRSRAKPPKADRPEEVTPLTALETKKQAFIQALDESMGIVVSACRKLDIHRSTYYIWRLQDEAFRAETDRIIEEQIDRVEGALLKKILEGDTTSIIFYLKTKGASRGYGTKTETRTTIGAKKAQGNTQSPEEADDTTIQGIRVEVIHTQRE